MTAAAAKRALDLILGVALSLLAAPIMLALAVAMLVVLRSWPFFTQERVGKDGRTFRIVKIRTLPPGTPQYASKEELGDLSGLSQFLRRSHVDELPQLLLVVLGRLSLVGPRPEMPFLAEAMDDGFAAARTSVRPGCTGLWQVSPASDDPIADAPEYDSWYVACATLRLDVWLLWRTALLMMGLGGRVDLDDVPRWTTWRPGTEVAQADAAADAVS